MRWLDSNSSVDGLVGYDTALTRQGSRVRTPVDVVFLFLHWPPIINSFTLQILSGTIILNLIIKAASHWQARRRDAV